MNWELSFVVSGPLKIEEQALMGYWHNDSLSEARKITALRVLSGDYH